MRLGVVTEAFAERALPDVLDLLARVVPAVTELELGAGGYAPTTHCDRAHLLADEPARHRWLDELDGRGFRVAALNVWGNPLHPDAELAGRHDADLREAIRLAGLLGVDRVLALAGCPAALVGDRTPHFAGGGWLPYLEGLYERQWEERGAPYWAELSELARREHRDLLLCVELHPGTLVYNHETFARFAALGDNLAANVDPSHFFWQRIDPLMLVQRLPGRIGHAHAKDVVFDEERLALNGLLDHRWPDEEAPWTFATVGRGRDGEWWRAFAAALEERGVETLAIEHEDPAVAAEDGIAEAARVLVRAGRAEAA